jgi:hypothetical protein
MEAMRESWTDARLDDLREEAARRFDEVDRRFDTLERRMDNGFDRVDVRFEQIEARFDALQRTLLQIGGGVVATLIAGFFGVIVAQL